MGTPPDAVLDGSQRTSLPHYREFRRKHDRWPGCPKTPFWTDRFRDPTFPVPPSIAITPALGSQRFGGPYPGNAFGTGSQTHGDTPDGKRISGIFGHANLGAAFAGLDEVARKCPPPDKLNGIPGCVVNALSIETQSFVSRSKHPGGVHASRCDGSVQFYVDGIDLTVWRGLSTARGAEPVFDP